MKVDLRVESRGIAAVHHAPADLAHATSGSRFNAPRPASIVVWTDIVLEEKSLNHGIMGVMYTVCKEKGGRSYAFIAFRLLADWLQLWLLVVHPPEFAIPDGQLWWKIVSFVSLNQFMAARVSWPDHQAIADSAQKCAPGLF
jgi:hypothetical protein